MADSVLLAALARGLVDVAVRQWHRRVRPLDLSQQTLRAAAWRASRHGITEDLYDPLADGLAPAWRVVERLREHAGPALEANGDATLVERALGRLRAGHRCRAAARLGDDRRPRRRTDQAGRAADSEPPLGTGCPPGLS